MRGRPCFQVEFSDGEVIVADEQHQWVTWTSHAAGFVPPQVVTTGEMAAALRSVGGRSRFAVAVPRPLELPEADLLVPPYLLGAALAGRTVPSVGARARALAVVGGGGFDGTVPAAASVPADGRIPPSYLRASVAQRRELLAGLLGVPRVAGPAHVELPTAELAADVRELIHSLGFQSEVTAASPGRHVIRFTDALPWRYVVAVRAVPSVPVRCVQVSSADQLYLAGQAMIPTHNSALALDFARSATIKHKLPTVVFSLEMGRNEITMRLLSAEARVPMHVMRTGQMSDDDWARLARRMSEVADAPLFIDDSPNMSLMEIRAKCRRLKQRHDLKLVIIDYLQLMSSSSRRVENRQQEVSEFSRSLKLLAKELEVPVVALSQLNRGPEQRQDKRPLLSDLRESGCMTADTALLRADTGASVTFGELLRDGWDGVLVWSLDDAASARSGACRQRLPVGDKGCFPAPAGLRPRGQGDREPPVPRILGVDATGGSPARRPGGDPAPDPGAAGTRSGLVGAPARAARAPHRGRLRGSKPARALHVQRSGEPGVRRGGGRG